jgi:hypothetical protein
MGLAGSSILSIGVPHVRLSASSAKESEADPPFPTVLELKKLAYFYGREYFVLRSGRAKVIFQVDRADLGPAFAYMLFDAEDAKQSTRKDGAFNFDPEEGFTSSALRVELGGFSFCAFGQETDCHWVDLDGVPAIESVWWASGVRVTERIIALVGAEAILRTVLLDGSRLAGDEVVNARLFLPRGQFRGSGQALVQDGRGYGSGLVVLGNPKVQADKDQGYVEIGPFTLGPQKSASFEALHFFEIPSRGIDSLYTHANTIIAAGVQEERQKTKATWESTSKVITNDRTIQDLYDKARFGLLGMIADDGTMDAGIFEYGRQWVRDTSNSALGALHTGHFELARKALARVLTKMISDEGATAIASEYDTPDREEFDQMGELLHALKSYRDWTGDDSLLQEHKLRLIALIERPLQPKFRDETGMVHNRREFWEREFDDAYELAYQTYLALGLREAAELAPSFGAEDRAERWRKEADRILQVMLSHSTRALVADGHLIKRRNVTGEVADLVPTGQGARPDVPFNTEKHNRLYPDASMALPIALGIVDPRSPLALKTLDELEQLWNMRWTGGGHERYNSSSEPDTPGPWPFASCFILRALHESGLFDRSRRVLEWLNTVQGGRTGFWFEEIPLLGSNTKACGIIPWTSAEVALFVVRHLLGVRFEGTRVVVRPALYPDSPPIAADLRFRSGRLRIEIEGWGTIKKAYVDGTKLKRRSDGSIVLPGDFTSGTVRIQTDRRSGG